MALVAVDAGVRVQPPQSSSLQTAASSSCFNIQGFTLSKLSCISGEADFPEGRFETFSRPLKKGMKPRGWATASEGARQRSAESLKQGLGFPAYHFEEANLLWDEPDNLKDKQSWRLPSAEEREVLFGFPAGWTRVKQGQAAKQVLSESSRM